MTTTLAPPRPAPVGATAPASRRVSFAVLLGLAVLTGFALRAAIALTDDAPSTDEIAYLRSGLSIAAGDGFAREGHPELHFPPVAPLLFGTASHLFDDPHTGVVVLTLVAGTALIVPLALLARRIAGDRAGVATAFTAALAPGLSTLVATGGGGSEAEYALFVVTALWLVVASRDHRDVARLWRVLAAGALVGLAYLTRPEGVFTAVPLAVGVGYVATRGVAGTSARLRAAGVLVAAFAAPVVACIVPYSMYLHSNTGDWELTAKTQDVSIEAWQAIARGDRQARDRVLYALDSSGLHFSADRGSLLSLAAADPSGYLQIVRSNTGNLVEVTAVPEHDQFLAWMLLPLPVWLLAVFGAWRYRRSRTVWLILSVAALPVLTALAFFVQARYLVVTVALAIVLVGIGIATVRVRPTRRVVAGAVAALLAVSVVQDFRGDGGWWHPADHLDQRLAGEWIAAHSEPDDRIMTRSMVVEFYADRTGIAMPYADLDQILRYARHYGARYLVADWYTMWFLRPQLAPLRDHDTVPGLRLVHEVTAEGRTSRVFALDPPPAPSDDVGPSLGFVGDDPD